MSVTDLAAWRAARAAAKARRSRHPVAAGGPHADTLAFIDRQLVPQGYRPGLWTNTVMKHGHAIRAAAPGYAETRCGLTVGSPRRADAALPLCPGCFPS